MELGTTIIGLGATALCIVPFVLMRRSTKKKEHELINGLKVIAASYNREVSIYDCGIDFAVGISAARDFVFFVKIRNEEMLEQCIPLNAIQKCRIDSTKRSIKTKGGHESVTDKLELTFLPIDKSIAASQFEFFNSEDHFQLNGELQLIKKWEALINEILSGKKP
ncbi:hypothetical protein [Marinoscillum sp. 108]|uniref:hypothetical protein n=1 Tax=Marinoscillum sp. 108 TaxID=2653151 RepID=UPI0012F39A4B|nr:hypothetical protein [Marinoscillum sp. 108]VXD11216.1 conserved hypothetical protein [Marinoscillum sp. 108]